MLHINNRSCPFSQVCDWPCAKMMAASARLNLLFGTIASPKLGIIKIDRVSATASLPKRHGIPNSVAAILKHVFHFNLSSCLLISAAHSKRIETISSIVHFLASLDFLRSSSTTFPPWYAPYVHYDRLQVGSWVLFDIVVNYLGKWVHRNRSCTQSVS